MDAGFADTVRLTDPPHEPSLAFIVDDGARDPGVERFQLLSGDVAQVKLTDVLLGAGCRYSAETRLLVPPISLAGSGLGMNKRVVIDRVIEVSDETVMLLTDGTGGLSRGQVSFCYEKLLRAQNMLAGHQVMYSTVGKLVPLVTQWRWVRGELPELQTPDFVYGYGPETVDVSGFENAIYGSPLNLYQWRPNERPPGEVWDTFVIDRPKGQPLLTTVLGDQADHCFLGADVEPVQAVLANRLTAHAAVLKELFSARIGEMLWFIDDQRITFASFSHALYASAAAASFDNMALRYLSTLQAQAQQ